MDSIKEWTSLLMPELLTRTLAEKTGKGSVLNHPSCPPDDPIGQGTCLLYTSDAADDC